MDATRAAGARKGAWAPRHPATKTADAEKRRSRIIDDSDVYPLLLADAARVDGVKKIVVAAFTDETSPDITNRADEIEWLRGGQLGELLSFFRDAEVRNAIMAGQVAPDNLFSLRSNFKAMFLLARLKKRNAESMKISPSV